MAIFSTAGFFGDIPVALTPAELDRIQRADPYLGQRSRSLTNPPTLFPLVVSLAAQVPAGGSAASRQVDLPFPCKVVAIDSAHEAQGGGLSALTLDLQADTGSGFASLMDGGTPASVLPGAVTESVRVGVEDGNEDLDFGTKLQITYAATGGTVDGAAATLWLKRL